MDEQAKRAATADLYALPGHLLWRAAARVTRQLNRTLPGPADIHAYAALLALADHEPQSQRGLARLVDVSGTTMTSVADGLQREGLVVRVRNPHDRRSYSLTRTAAGRAAVRRWRPDVVHVEAELTLALSPAEADRLRRLLHRLVAD